MINFKPLLGYSKIVDPDELTYPLIASVKVDGYRCSIVNKIPKTRSGKDIANKHTAKILREMNLPPLDGELILRDDNSFNGVQSAFSSHHTTPDFEFVVFDCFEFALEPYEKRFKRAAEYLKSFNSNGRLSLARNFVCNNSAEVWELFHMAIDNGDEGLILRSPGGIYKFGRSTFKEGYMLKLKPREDAEAIIIGFNELMHNEDAGNSIKQENMVAGDTLGSIICKMPSGKEFSAGTGEGLTAEMRKFLWDNRAKLIGKPITYSYHKLTPAGIPREPRIKGVRDLGDML